MWNEKKTTEMKKKRCLHNLIDFCSRDNPAAEDETYANRMFSLYIAVCGFIYKPLLCRASTGWMRGWMEANGKVYADNFPKYISIQ